MDASLQSKIHDLSTNGYQVEIGRYISMAWENFLKASGSYIGYAIISTLIAIGLGLFLSGLGGIVTPIFTIGFAIVANKIQQGKQTEFGQFFDGFKSNPGHIILVALVSSIITIALFVPAIFSLGFGFIGEIISSEATGIDPDLSSVNWLITGIFGLISMIGATYLTIAWSWANFFVVFKGLDFWQAMEASRKIISKEWFSFFGFGIVLGLISFAGLLCFFVGMLVTTPLVTIASFIAFEQIIGLNEDNEIDLIDHLIDDEV